MDGQIDLVIFDCDGVLIDSEGLSARVLIAALAELGVDVDFDYFARHFLGRSFPTVAKTIRETFDVGLPADFEAAYRARLLDAFAADLKVTDGVTAVLDRVAVPYCVATSSSPPRAARSLAITGLDAYFPRVFTASEVAMGKPAPDLFLHAAAQSGAAPGRCLVIEDSLPGIEAALAAGMQVLRYVGGTHLCQVPQNALDTPANVRNFDKWADFFHIMPDLMTGARA